ncbi:MAG: hypothetical protein ABIF77_10490 [bacterium]
MKRVLTTCVLLLTLFLMSSGVAIAGSGVSGPDFPPIEPPTDDPADSGDMVFGVTGDPDALGGGNLGPSDAEGVVVDTDNFIDVEDLVEWLLQTLWFASL